MLFYCYKITNLINGKIYVGQTNRPTRRWTEHKVRNTGYPISNAIKKYGADSFEFKIIAITDQQVKIDECEKYFIKSFKTNVKRFGYNLTAGGDGMFGRKHTNVTRAKMSIAHTGHKHSKETIEKMRKSNTGIRSTPETCEKIRQARIGTKRQTLTLLKIRGENSWKAKLNWNIVNEIREKYSLGNITLTKLASVYGVSYSTIQNIISNVTWRI